MKQIPGEMWKDMMTRQKRMNLPTAGEKFVFWFGVFFIGYIIVRALTTTYAIY